MAEKTLKYNLSQEAVNFLLQALNGVQIRGVQNARSLVIVTEMLQNPINAEDLEKEQLETLKAKYEKPAKEKK